MTDTDDLSTADLIEKARDEAVTLTAWQREGGLERAILLRALADRLETLERVKLLAMDELGTHDVEACEARIRDLEPKVAAGDRLTEAVVYEHSVHGTDASIHECTRAICGHAAAYYNAGADSGRTPFEER